MVKLIRLVGLFGELAETCLTLQSISRKTGFEVIFRYYASSLFKYFPA